MACCAVAAYIVWRVLSLHDRVNQFLTQPEDSSQPGTASLGYRTKNHYETAIISPYASDEAPLTTDAKKPVAEASRSTCVLSLTGITCGACVKQINSVVNNLPAVKDCQISLLLSRAVIEYEVDKISATEIISRIQDAGYGAIRQTSCGHHNLQDTISAIIAADESWNVTRSQIYTDLRYSILLSAAVVLFSAFSTWLPSQLPTRLYALLHFIVGISCLYASRRLHVKGYASLLKRSPRGVSTLSSLAIVLTFLHSLAVLAAPVTEPTSKGASTSRADARSSLTSMALISAVVLAGQAVKHGLTRRSLGHTLQLANLLPKTARVQAVPLKGAEDGSRGAEDLVTVSMLQDGDVVIVSEGDRLPADGTIISGKAEINQSWLTGDNHLKPASAGDSVLAGCLIARGHIAFRIQRCGLDSSLGRLIDLVNAANAQPAPPHNSLDSSKFVDLILLVAACTGLVLLLRGSAWQVCLQRVVHMLLCACPCALELSVPVSLVSAAASAARLRVRFPMRLDLVEHAAAAKTVLFDKTGTLTEGRFSLGWHSISSEWNYKRENRRDWWAIVGAVEKHASSHPLKDAITIAVQEQLGEEKEMAFPPPVTNAKYSPGGGVQAWVALSDQQPVHVAIGSKSFLKGLGIKVDNSAIPQEWRTGINTTVCVSIAKEHTGILVLQDRLRPSAKKLVQGLLKSGLRVGMITGDSWTAANHVACSLGIPRGDVQAELLPLDKADIVKEAKKRGPVLAVGDNYNDMAAFSEASLGIYVGSGYTHGHGAEAALLADPESNETDLQRLQQMLTLARRTIGRVRQNTCLSLGYNILAILITSGVLSQIDSRLAMTS